MKIISIKVRNFRSLKDVEISCDQYDVWTLIGQNNSGKSAFIDAIRLFYGDIKLKTEDFYRHRGDSEPVEITISYKLTDDEYDLLPEKYKLHDNELKVIKTFTEQKLGGETHGFIYDENGDLVVDNEDFFGAPNVPRGKLGELIYIPAVKELSEELKKTKSSLFSKIISRVLTDTVSELGSWEKLVQATEDFSKELRSPKKGQEGKLQSIVEIEDELTSSLESWELGVRLDLSPPSIEDLVLSGAELKLIDRNTEDEEQPHMLGSGAQRSILNSLMMLWAKAAAKKSVSEKKKFNSNMTIILYEEPEALLHYDQERKLIKYLEEISKEEDRQVIATTHSPNFISTKKNALSNIVKFSKDMQTSSVHQATNEYLQDLESTQERFDFALWLNPDRNTLFFVDHVILTEGSTDKVFLNYLIDDNNLSLNIYVVDCGSKQNTPYYMELCSSFGVKHSVMFDRDKDKSSEHKQWNQDIEDARNAYTLQVLAFEDNLEKRLDIDNMSRNGYEKPIQMLNMLRDEKINKNKLQEFIEFLKGPSDDK